MKIVFRPIQWMFRKDWYTTQRLSKGYIDCGWFTIVLENIEKKLHSELFN